MGKWINWEIKTKKLYEELYQELTNLREIAAAIHIKKYIIEVDKELELAQKKLNELETLDYNINTLIGCQDSMYKEFMYKLKEIFD